jgi:hypothetical protein
MKAPHVVEEDPLTGEIIGAAIEVHTVDALLPVTPRSCSRI